MKSFADRHVVVTGGTGFLGTAVCDQLLDQGAKVHVPVYDVAQLDHFARRSEIEAVTGVDLSQEASASEFFGALPGLFASIHVAGGFAMAPLAETSVADYERLVKLNVTTCFLSCREAVKRMRAGGAGGRIVNVAARPALVPSGGMAAYAATKAAVAGLTQSLADELATEGIWVNAIVPSIMDTPVNREAMPDADFDCWPKVSEVADTITFLASPHNTSTRGALVPVYGKS